MPITTVNSLIDVTAGLREERPPTELVLKLYATMMHCLLAPNFYYMRGSVLLITTMSFVIIVCYEYRVIIVKQYGLYTLFNSNNDGMSQKQ